MSKTTFNQIFECIPLKVLITGSLQIFANSHTSCVKKNLKKCLSIFLGKMSLTQTVYFFQFQFLIQSDPAYWTRFSITVHSNYVHYIKKCTSLLQKSGIERNKDGNVRVSQFLGEDQFFEKILCFLKLCFFLIRIW